MCFLSLLITQFLGTVHTKILQINCLALRYRSVETALMVGRRGISFSGFHQGFRHSPVFPQWLLIDPRRSFFGLLNSPRVQPYTGLSLSHSGCYHGRPFPWVPSFLNLLSDSGYCGKSCLKVLKYSYLQYTSNGVTIGGIKSLPPRFLVWRLNRGGRYKSLGLPTLQSMTNVTLFERYSQVGRFNFLGIMIATLTLTTKGGER